MFFQIFKRVNAVFESDYAEKSCDFISGFMTCFDLFEIGYKKTEHYRIADKHKEEIKRLNLIIGELKVALGYKNGKQNIDAGIYMTRPNMNGLICNYTWNSTIKKDEPVKPFLNIVLKKVESEPVQVKKKKKKVLIAEPREIKFSNPISPTTRMKLVFGFRA